MLAAPLKGRCRAARRGQQGGRSPPPPLPGAGHIHRPQRAAAGQGLPAVRLRHGGTERGGSCRERSERSGAQGRPACPAPGAPHRPRAVRPSGTERTGREPGTGKGTGEGTGSTRGSSAQAPRAGPGSEGRGSLPSGRGAGR